MTNKIFHIVLPEVWKTFEEKPEYTAPSLETEGFIHCSFEDQLDGVLERYYSGESTVLLLELDVEMLSTGIVIEASTNNELYPHIYGSINREAVVNVIERAIERSS